MIEAILFDVLHTLVDDSGFPRHHLNELLMEEEGVPDPAVLARVYQGVTARFFNWEQAASEYPFRSIRQRHHERLRALYEELELSQRRDAAVDAEHLWQLIGTCQLYPEVAEVLPELADRGYRLAVISNADRDDPVVQVLLRAGLPVRFEAVVTSQGAGAYKPNRRIFEHALRQLDLEPGQAVLVGDSPHADMLGASRVGMPAIWVNRKGETYPPGCPPPVGVVEDLRGVLPMLAGAPAGSNRTREQGEDRSS